MSQGTQGGVDYTYIYMHLLRRLRLHGVATNIMLLFYSSGSQTWGRDPKWGPQIILWGPQMISLMSILFSLSYFILDSLSKKRS